MIILSDISAIHSIIQIIIFLNLFQNKINNKKIYWNHLFCPETNIFHPITVRTQFLSEKQIILHK